MAPPRQRGNSRNNSRGSGLVAAVPLVLPPIEDDDAEQLLLVTLVLSKLSQTLKMTKMKMTLVMSNDHTEDLINLQPLTPTKCFLHYSCGEECVMAIMKVDSEEKEETTAINNDMCTDKSDDYAETYWIFEKYGLEFLREELIQMYDAMGLQPYMDYDSIQSIIFVVSPGTQSYANKLRLNEYNEYNA